MPIQTRELNSDLIRSVELLAEVFDSMSIRYALIGGLATMLRGRPRFTQDVDILLDVPQLVLPGLLEKLADRGFKIDLLTMIREYVHEQMTTCQYGVARIDLLKPVLPLYARTIANASRLQWTAGVSLPVAMAEGLILTKMVSFRAQDQADIEVLLIANRKEIDLAMIAEEWSVVSAGEEARTAWLEQTIRRLVYDRG